MFSCEPSKIVPGSRSQALSTQPPVSATDVVESQREDQEEDEYWHDHLMIGGTISDLFKACEWAWEEREEAYCILNWSKDRVHTASDVDTVTGAEMLSILGMIHHEPGV